MAEVMEIQERKMARAYMILTNGDRPSQVDDNTYTVPSQSGNWIYTIRKEGNEWHCDCPDHNKWDVDCKHIYTVKFWLNLRDSLKEKEKEVKPLNFHACDRCGSYDIVKNGSRMTKQGKKTRLMCKNCKHTFVLEEEGFNDMKFDSEIVTLALDLYFKGMSLRKIEHHIKQFRNIQVDHSTVYLWIKKYTEIISAYVDNLNPELGEMWGVDEMALKVKHGGIMRTGSTNIQWVWLWNMMDTKTRFLISNMITKRKGVEDAKRIFKDSKKKAGKPKFVVSDGLGVYHKAFNKVFYDHHHSCKHISEVGIRDRINNNRVERLHGTIRDRDKVMRGLGNPESSEKIIDGHRIYYNFVRPHMTLDGNTPAEEAGLNLNLGENKWLGLIKRSVEKPSTVHSTTEGQTTLDGWCQP